MVSIHWQLLQAVALGSLVAWASGLRLYLVVFVLGLSARLGYLTLPEGLAILSHSYVIAVAGFLLAIEFLADKIPGIDSAWDAVHTFIRIPAGRCWPPARPASADVTAITVAAGLLGGTITAGTHFAKAGGRAAINASPEPFSNWIASFTEDALVLGGIWVALNHPGLLVSLAVFIAFAAWFIIVFTGFVRRRFLAGARRGSLTLLVRRPTPDQCLGECARVNVLDLAPHGQPTRDPRHREPLAGEHLRHVMGRGFAFDGEIGRENHLLHHAVRCALEQPVEVDLARPDAVERR